MTEETETFTVLQDDDDTLDVVLKVSWDHLGITLELKHGFVTVCNVKDGSIGAGLGIEVEDILLRINRTVVVESSLHTVEEVVSESSEPHL